MQGSTETRFPPPAQSYQQPVFPSSACAPTSPAHAPWPSSRGGGPPDLEDHQALDACGALHDNLTLVPLLVHPQRHLHEYTRAQGWAARAGHGPRGRGGKEKTETHVTDSLIQPRRTYAGTAHLLRVVAVEGNQVEPPLRRKIGVELIEQHIRDLATLNKTGYSAKRRGGNSGGRQGCFNRSWQYSTEVRAMVRPNQAFGHALDLPTPQGKHRKREATCQLEAKRLPNSV